MKIEILHWVLENLRKVKRKICKTQGEKTKTQGKNSKLKEKTQGLGGTRLLRVPKWFKKKSLIYPLYIREKPIKYPKTPTQTDRMNSFLREY